MADVIATIWDFDKTLIPGYMQKPIFKKYGVDEKTFWTENNDEINKYRKAGLDVNADTYYLNRLIRKSQKGGDFDGLNNEVLEELGAQLTFYDGAIDLFEEIKTLNDEAEYRNFDVKFENYIVSTGLRRMIQGSAIYPFVKKIWGAELIDEVGEDNVRRFTQIGDSLDNTSKTKAIFEINKGVGIAKGATIDVNTKIPLEERRVQFCNMVYVADGPSDIPAFSVVLQKGGSCMAVYPKHDPKAFAQVDRLNCDGRVQMVAEADYKKDSAAYLWLMRRLRSQAEEIIKRKKAAYTKPAGTPQHLL